MFVFILYLVLSDRRRIFCAIGQLRHNILIWFGFLEFVSPAKRDLARFAVTGRWVY